MKKIVFLLTTVMTTVCCMAQNCYWVYLNDKQGTTFDPYTYFDAKAIARYQQNHANLYDESNYPLNESYVQQVNALSEEEVGQSRWLNAVAVMAYAEQMQQIQALPCVKNVVMIATQGELAAYKNRATVEHTYSPRTWEAQLTDSLPKMANQLLRMQGDKFRDNGIDGKGIRIAVFDGGFPAVNTHEAFQHLRDNKQIIATWNFCNKKENVYGWNSHGTMVLSCIAGILNGKQLGLATGATFLLARTEVEAEPYKEEVWWMQAVEWADKNGADVVNSSLGYGKDRHYTFEMDGRSTVAKAANMAARKGILVCNSAGNEGDDNSWKTIITPGDADSILTVGGITASLTEYSHISFSSFGPTADGRMKPNVCNFGNADVADPSKDNKMTSVYGTSFSSPLTAGFCACAWQTRKGYTAMQMKAEIEKSADLYPYFDYAFGYGVPQASYFVANKKQAQRTFTIVDDEDYIKVVATGARNGKRERTDENGLTEMARDHVFLKVANEKGVVQDYMCMRLEQFTPQYQLSIPKKSLMDVTLTVNYDGYTEDYKLSESDNEAIRRNHTARSFYCMVEDSTGMEITDGVAEFTRSLADNKISSFNDTWFVESFLEIGVPMRTATDEQQVNFAMPWSSRLAVNYQVALKRWYRLGVAVMYGKKNFSMKIDVQSPLDRAVLPVSRANNDGTAYDNDITKKTATYRELGLELFQRVRLLPGGSLRHNGTYWDLGIWGSYGWNKYSYTREFTNDELRPLSSMEYTARNLAPLQDYKWNWGLSTRIVYNWVGVYARYRLNSYTPTTGSNAMEKALLPRLELGVIFNF